MAKYLDPRNDLVFKKVFGEHKDLLKSFLNSLIPLEEGSEIVDLEYLPNEMVPEFPFDEKNTLVDVRCKDNFGRQFLVEMQVYWTMTFRSRMVLNASKAYSAQIGISKNYNELQPVYVLGLVDKNIKSDTDEFYHHYQIINKKDDKDIIEDLQFILVELPKQFSPEKLSGLSLMHRKMAVLWLRFLKETGETKQAMPSEFTENRDIKRALDICEKGAYTPAELAFYEARWDTIRTVNTYGEDKKEEGREEGKVEVAKSLYRQNIPLSVIVTATGFSEERLKEILNL